MRLEPLTSHSAQSPLYPLNWLTTWTNSVWALASAIGPLIGAGFASTNWRFLFYLNIPLTLIVIAICGAFVDLKTPEGTFREKLGRIDW